MTAPLLPSRGEALRLLGGWGYFNLGDEAILAGYLQFLDSISTDVSVGSPNPERTAAAQLGAPAVSREGRASGAAQALLGGGGYLNGSWRQEIRRKLRRLEQESTGVDRVTVHGVELRRIASDPALAQMMRTVIGDGEIGVRDEKSADEAHRLGVESTIMPDSISLLYPHLDRYFMELPQFADSIVVNVLDIRRRADSAEADIDADALDSGLRALAEAHGRSMVAIIVGEGDYEYARTLGDISILKPRTVADLVSVLGSARAVVSVRMHPALIASQLGTPVVSVPYCGKVAPTLDKVGIREIVLQRGEERALVERDWRKPDHRREWDAAHAVNAAWLSDRIGRGAQR